MTKLKKIFTAAFAAACTVLAVSALAACNSSHVHAFGEWSDLVNNCTDRVQVRVCSDCGLKETQTLTAAGHTYGEWDDVVDSCEKHVQSRTCSKCGAEEINELEAGGHGYGEWTLVVDTCTERVKKRVCDDCGHVEILEDLFPKGHKFGEWQDYVNSCTDHVQIQICENCGYRKYNDIRTEGHSFGEWTDLVDTCTQHIQVHGCSVCGVEETNELAPHGHKFVADRCVYCGTLGYNGEALSYLDAYNGTYGFDYFERNGLYAELALYKRIDEQARIFHVNSNVNAVWNTESLTAGNFYEAFRVKFTDLKLTSAQASAVWKTFRDDNPLYYWLTGSASVSSDGDLILKCYNDYAQGSEREKANELIYAKTAEYIAALSEDDSAYMKALAFHDEIINSIEYAYKSDGSTPSDEAWAHNILGLFEKKGGTCETYSKAFQLLLNAAGVENAFVTGTANGGHSWNLVRLDDGGWYWCDLTWDDKPEEGYGLSHDYFMVNDTEKIGSGTSVFSDTHEYETPSGSGTKFLYALPDRSAVVYTDENELILYKTFNTMNAMYAVSGYHTVRLINIIASGDIVIGNEVVHAGKTYAVVAIGALKNGKFGAGTVLRGAETSVTVPSSVRHIDGLAFSGGAALTAINYGGDFEAFSAVKKADNWCDGADNLKIVCADGTYDARGNLLN